VWGLATPLFISGSSALLDAVLTFRDLNKHHRRIPGVDLRRIHRSLYRASVGRLAVVVSSVLLFTDVPGLFYWLAVPMITTLLAACINCWDLLVGARERLTQ